MSAAKCVRVESIGPEAAALVHRLMIEAFEEYREWLQPPTGALSESIEDVARGIAASGAAVAWMGEIAVGAVRFDIETDHLYIGRLAVPPAYRGRGVASALMAHAEERAAQLRLPLVRVEVRSALPGNIALFERFGFVQVATRPHPRLPSATSVTLEKPVSKRFGRERTEEIHSLIARLPRHDHQTSGGDIPGNGIYFFYEWGETALVGGQEVERIVRVGTHLATGRLPKRIRAHFAGNRRGSVFRRHVGGALLSRDDQTDPRIAQWVKQKGILIPEVEQIVGAVLNDQFYFRCVQVNNAAERFSLERGLIALLAQHPLGPPSEAWLGRRAVHALVRQSGLWNTQHVDADPVGREDVDRLAWLIRSTLGECV